MTDRDYNIFDGYKFGDYITIENFIEGKFQKISGIVIKSYDRGRVFIRVTKHIGLPVNTRGWSKYGIGENEGYFYSPESISSKGFTTSAISPSATYVDEFITYIDKSVERINGQGTNNTSKQLSTAVVECYADNLTFVYLMDKDIGGWSRGIGEDSKKLATYRALIKYYKNLENSIVESK